MASISGFKMYPGFYFEQLSDDAVQQEKRSDFKKCVREDFINAFSKGVLDSWSNITKGPRHDPKDGHIEDEVLCKFVRRKLYSLESDLDIHDDPDVEGCWRDPKTGKWCKERAYALLKNDTPWLMIDALKELERKLGKPIPNDHIRSQVGGIHAYLKITWYVEEDHDEEPAPTRSNAGNARPSDRGPLG